VLVDVNVVSVMAAYPNLLCVCLVPRARGTKHTQKRLDNKAFDIVDASCNNEE